jgi:hypothetical protein
MLACGRQSAEITGFNVTGYFSLLVAEETGKIAIEIL